MIWYIWVGFVYIVIGLLFLCSGIQYSLNHKLENRTGGVLDTVSFDGKTYKTQDGRNVYFVASIEPKNK